MCPATLPLSAKDDEEPHETDGPSHVRLHRPASACCSLWVAVRHAFLLQVMLHLRNVVGFPCRPRQRLLESTLKLLLRLSDSGGSGLGS